MNANKLHIAYEVRIDFSSKGPFLSYGSPIKAPGCRFWGSPPLKEQRSYDMSLMGKVSGLDTVH